MNLQLKHQALHDPLTQLPNRLFLQQKLDQTLTHIQYNPGQAFALLFLDADRFKVINDSLGHNLGDHFLIDLSKRLHECVREQDIVARFGGDEFVILVEDAHHQISSTATSIAKRIHQKLQHPFQLAEHRILMSVSIGIVLSTLEYTSHEALLRDADIAMYQAKSQGRGRYQIFQQGNVDNSRLSLEQDFYQALQMQALDIHYQPIIHLESRQLIGFEALARWFHPQKGFISPEVFIPLAEESQVIKQLDLFVLQAAIQNVQQWQADFGISLHLNVNVSAQHFYEAAFAETLYAVLESFHFPPEQLKVEITESILLTPSTQVKENIEKLKEMNIDLHIDDFGIGYSSLQYLQHFDVEMLKIDRSFITHLITSEKHNKLVCAIITMSEIMGFKVIAEGIETQEQCQLLASLGCTFGQGYLFSRPLAVKDIAAYIASSQSRLMVVN